jgi:hypothetical protein
LEIFVTGSVGGVAELDGELHGAARMEREIFRGRDGILSSFVVIRHVGCYWLDIGVSLPVFNTRRVLWDV